MAERACKEDRRAAAYLRRFVELNDLNRKDLAAALGTRARISEVLAGKRRIGITMARRLVSYFGADPLGVLGLPTEQP